MDEEIPKLSDLTWSPSQVRAFLGLGKDILNSWSERTFGKERGGRGERVKSFSPEEVRGLAVLRDGAIARKPADVIDSNREHLRNASGIANEWLGSVGLMLAAGLSAAPATDSASPIVVALQTIARRMSEVMPAEHCAVFLQFEPTSDDLISVADSRGTYNSPQFGFRLPHSGWTWLAFKKREILNLFGPELDEGPGNMTGHLRNVRTSLLVIPIFDSKNRSIGVLKAENKTVPWRGREGSEFPGAQLFTPDDVIKASLLASQVSLLLEIRTVYASMIELLNAAHHPSGFRGIADVGVRKAIELTKATLGEISLEFNPEAEHFDLQVEAASRGNALSIGYRVPEPTITCSVLRTGKPRIVKNVSEARDYLACNGDKVAPIRSEIVFPVSMLGKTRGVINVESTNLGGEGGLDERDVPAMELVSLVMSVGQRITSVHTSVIQTLDDREATFDAVLTSVLASKDPKLSDPLSESGWEAVFKNGIAYAADYQKGMLSVVSWSSDIRREKFSLSFQEPLDPERFAAARVLCTGISFFCRYPQKNEHVDQEGLRKFDIEGSLLALPVGILNPSGPMIVGAVVIWSDKTLRPEVFAESDMDLAAKRLTKYTSLKVVRS